MLKVLQPLWATYRHPAIDALQWNAQQLLPAPFTGVLQLVRRQIVQRFHYTSGKFSVGMQVTCATPSGWIFQPYAQGQQENRVEFPSRIGLAPGRPSVMRALWKGAISFGLVNIPVGLYSGTRQKAVIDLDMLRDSDQSRIRYKKVAEADGKEVPNEHIVKGYEYEKGRYVILRPEDYAQVQIKSNQTIDIREFVNLADIEPQFFDTPYYLAPEKGGAKAYALLRQVLVETGLAGIAKVVIRPPREHLAVLKPYEDILILETMHFADELRDPAELKPPAADVGEKELKMARTLVESMTGKWQPEKWHDEYRQSLMKLIEEKIESGDKAPKQKRPGKESPGKVIDLVSLLQQSLGENARGKKRETAKRHVKKKAA